METLDHILTPDSCRIARTRAGLTQAELARRAGISRPTLVNFENGKASPHRSSVVALKSALSGSSQPQPSCLADTLRALQRMKPDLKARGVEHLAVFGSVARMEDSPDSDIDIVVDIDPARHFDIFDLAGIAGDISRSLGRQVDVLERKSLKPSFLHEVERDQIHVF
jgi:predicted nucleotidyltransferase/DNA-binding XRE family transcriptional regulator